MNDLKQLQLAKDFWQQEFKEQSHLAVNCTQKKLDVKIKWIKTHLVNILTKHIKTIRIISFFKKWWNEEMKQTRKTLRVVKRRWKEYIRKKNQRLREIRNEYYRIIRKAKKQFWQFFLQNDVKVIFDRIQQKNTNRCWTILRFINLRTQTTISALKKSNEIMTIIMKDKKVLIRATVFLRSSQDTSRAREIERDTTHQSITAKTIRRALFEQAIKKASNSDKLIFKILKLLWK